MTTRNTLTIKTNVKAGGISFANHNQSALALKTNLKTGGTYKQHNQSAR